MNLTECTGVLESLCITYHLNNKTQRTPVNVISAGQKQHDTCNLIELSIAFHLQMFMLSHILCLPLIENIRHISTYMDHCANHCFLPAWPDCWHWVSLMVGSVSYGINDVAWCLWDVLHHLVSSTIQVFIIPCICYERNFSEFYLSIWNQLVFNQRLQLFVQSPQPYLLFFAWRK